MGLDISKITNAELKKLAYIKDDGDGSLNAEEFALFKSEAAAKEGVSAEDFNQAMGLYKSAPAATTEVVTGEKTEKKSDKKADKKALEVVQKNVKSDIEALIEGNKKARLNQDTSITLDNLVEKLTAKNPSGYASVIADVQEVITFVQGTEFDSKKQVEALEKKIKNNKDFNKFQKDLAENMVELAKREQINKEAEVIEGFYKDIKNDKKNAQNFSNYLKLVEDEIERSGLKDTSYYSEEAFDAVKFIIEQDAANIADQRRAQMIEKGSDNVSGKKVKKELLNAASETDKVYRNVVKKQEEENNLVGRWLDKDRTAEDLEKISEKDLKDRLGSDLFNVMRKYLDDPARKNADGTYNVRDLSDKLFERVGYDVWMNMSDDTQMSELQGAKNELKILTGRDLNEKDIKKIMKLVHIPREPKDRNFMRALKDSIIPGITGAVAAASAYQSLDVTQKVQLNMDASTAKDMIAQLQAAGINPDVSTGIDGKITVTVLQRVLQDNRALMALAGAGIGVLTGTLMNLIFGMENNEKSCISIADFDLTDERYTNIDNYKAYIKEVQPEAKANLIIALVDTFQAKYGDDWAKHFDSALKKFAGRGSVLNCLELRGGELVTVKPAKETKGDAEQKDDCNNDCRVQVTDESTAPTENTVDMTKIHNRQGGDTWKGLVEAYYPDLLEKCNGEMWGKNGAIRALKKALSVNEDGSFNAEIYKKLLEGGDIPKVIKLPLEVNGAKRADGKVNPEKVSGNGKALINKVGKDEIKVDKIPGTQLWKAVDGCDDNVPPQYGATPEEAVKNLKKVTDKTYTNEGEYIKK